MARRSRVTDSGLVANLILDHRCYAYVIAGPQEGVRNWCGQLGAMRVGRGLLSSRALIRSPEKIQLQTSGDTFWGNFEVYIRSILALLYGFLRALFSLQINPVMNVIVMIPTKTLAQKIIHKHHF